MGYGERTSLSPCKLIRRRAPGIIQGLLFAKAELSQEWICQAAEKCLDRSGCDWMAVDSNCIFSVLGGCCFPRRINRCGAVIWYWGWCRCDDTKVGRKTGWYHSCLVCGKDLFPLPSSLFPYHNQSCICITRLGNVYFTPLSSNEDLSLLTPPLSKHHSDFSWFIYPPFLSRAWLSTPCHLPSLCPYLEESLIWWHDDVACTQGLSWS